MARGDAASVSDGLFVLAVVDAALVMGASFGAGRELRSNASLHWCREWLVPLRQTRHWLAAVHRYGESRAHLLHPEAAQPTKARGEVGR